MISQTLKYSHYEKNSICHAIGCARKFYNFHDGLCPKSPPAVAAGKVGGASITIAYSSPSVKGRKIWGDLVPYGKAWRAGANEATTFATDKDITVEGKALKAGKYSVFVVASEKEWEFIFNSETGQWGIKKGGDANFDPCKECPSLLKVKPKKSASMMEQLTYKVGEKRGV